MRESVSLPAYSLPAHFIGAASEEGKFGSSVMLGGGAAQLISSVMWMLSIVPVTTVGLVCSPPRLAALRTARQTVMLP